ncbi:MAG: glycosyltransferase, partial [bacterium]|nr:glycosyltransferase [bacterium]
MRIGIDLQVLEQRKLTGIGKYALQIARHLLLLQSKHEFVLFVSATSPSFPPLARGGKLVVLPPKRIPFFTAHWEYAKIMEREKLDVLFGPANTLPLLYKPLSPSPELGALSPRQGRVTKRMTRCVITLHDLAIYKHPEWFPARQWFSTKFLVPKSIKRADKIIVPSQSTKKDLREMFGVSERKISVIPH